MTVQLQRIKKDIRLKKIKDVHPDCGQVYREDSAYKGVCLADVTLESGEGVQYVTATDNYSFHLVFFNPKTGKQEYPTGATSRPISP